MFHNKFSAGDRARPDWLSILKLTTYRPLIVTLVLLLLFGGVGYLWRLGSVGLVDETEPLFAEAARQMLVTGDWISPYFNGETRFDKPPLIYWCMAVAYRLVGVNEWGARLPSAMAAIASVGCITASLIRYGRASLPTARLVTDRFAQRNRAFRADWLSGWLGLGIAALTPLTIAWGRTGVSDMMLTACMCAAMLAFFHAYAAREHRAKVYGYIACYSAIGLGVLTKGPVAIVLPGLAIGSFLLHVGRLRDVWREMALLRGLCLIAGLCVPWFLAVTAVHGSHYTSVFFGHHNLERFTSVVNQHSAPWYFYSLVVLVGFAPFSIYLPGAIASLKVWKVNDWRQRPRSSHLGLFAFWWLTSTFIFFSISVTKLPSYLLPLLPAAAILVALWWRVRFFSSLRRLRQRSLGIWVSVACNIALFLALAIASLLVTRLLGEDSSAPNLLPAIEAARLPLWGALIWGMAALAAIGVVVVRQWRWIPVVNIAGLMVFVMLLVAVAFPVMDTQRQLPLRQLSLQAANELLPNEQLVAIGFMKPSITFYMQQNVRYAEGQSALQQVLSDWQEDSNHPSTGLVLGEIAAFEEWPWKDGALDPIADAGGYRLARIDVRED